MYVLRIFFRYVQVLKDLPILNIPLPDSNIQHAWYKFYVYIRSDYLLDGIDRDSIINKLVSLGLPAFSGSCSEVYLEKCLKGVLSQDFQRLPNAQKLGETSIIFLVHPTISQETIYKYAMGIRDVFLTASITK